jgi:hypothetical protein
VNAEQASSEYQPKGDWGGRAGHVTAKATDSARDPEERWTSPGYWRRHVLKGRCGTRETLPGAPCRAKDHAYKGQTENAGSREGVRGAHSTEEGGEKPLEGRGPALVTPQAEVSARAWSTDPTTPKRKCENSNDGYGYVPSGAGRGGSMRCMTGSTGVTSCGKRGAACGQVPTGAGA